MQILFSPKAKQDLNDIWDYSLENWGLVKAESYLRDISAKLNLVSDNLEVSQYIDFVREGYRKVVVNSHVVFFKVNDDRIEVIRILNHKMDFDRHLK